MSTTHVDTGVPTPASGVASGAVATTVPVTRAEIAELLGSAFDHGAASRESLLDLAHAAHARTEVLATLTQLPDHHYGHLRQLWVDLPHIPVEL